jgi:hypothetical protein
MEGNPYEAPLEDAGHPSRQTSFQFSLATLLVFVTGVCVAFSLVRWNASYGLMAAILTVCSGWSFAAVRAKHRRLAYILATPVLGVIGHLVLALPLSLALNAPSVEGGWFNPFAVVLISLSAIIAATILRRGIRAPGRMAPFGTMILAIYATAAAFPIIWGAALMALGLLRALWLHDDAYLMTGLLVGLVGFFLSPVVATLSLPLTIPLSMFGCYLLRRLDPPPPQTVKALRQFSTLNFDPPPLTDRKA